MKYIMILSVLIMIPNWAVAGNSNIPHTHTNTPIELEPISSNIGTQYAAVCFLSYGPCNNGDFGYGDDDMNIDTANQCQNEGYIKATCNKAEIPVGRCPYDDNYIKECKCKEGLINCNDVQDGIGDSCNEKYEACKCKGNLLKCGENQIGVGTVCEGKFSACKCPNTYTTCSCGGSSPCMADGITTYASCNSCCSNEYIYTSSNCCGTLTGDSCGGKYKGCNTIRNVGGIIYNCSTPIGKAIPGTSCAITYSTCGLSWYDASYHCRYNVPYSSLPDNNIMSKIVPMGLEPMAFYWTSTLSNNDTHYVMASWGGALVDTYGNNNTYPCMHCVRCF